MPSRSDEPAKVLAEITETATAERAECIMLNKGPYLPQALAR